APGRYTVRAIIGSDTLVRALAVQADPRVRDDNITDGVLLAQERHELAVRDAVSEARQLAQRARSVREQVTTRGGALAREADAIVRALETAEGRYQQPMLVAQFEYLYGMTTGADQPIPRDAAARLVTLRRQMAALKRRLDAVSRGTTTAD
nr:hypothetical protein [Gemmatimonadaceae bacterium]